MIEESTLSSIRAAEKKAIELRASAEKDSQKALEAAQKNAMELTSSSESEIERKNAVALKKFSLELAKRKEEVISRGVLESEKLKKSGEKKLPKALDFLLDEFRKEIEK